MKTPDTCRRLDEFLRIYQIGFVAVWPLLGLASGGAWTAGALVGLLEISACFNIFGGVLNDICDLETDRQCLERSDHWLVNGTVSVFWAWTLVMVQIPAMLIIHLAAGFRFVSLGWLVIAILGQAFYDVRGKRSRTPPLAEAGEGMAAWSLVFYGATCTSDVLPSLAWPTAAAGAAMLMLANAFHGGLRDLRDDLQAKVRTTPIWLGCSAGLDRVRISPAMSAYGASWLSVLLTAAWVIASDATPLTRLLTAAACVGNLILFIALHYLRKPAWDIALRAHVALLVLPMMAAFTERLNLSAWLTLLTVYVTPVLPLTWRLIRVSL